MKKDKDKGVKECDSLINTSQVILGDKFTFKSAWH